MEKLQKIHIVQNMGNSPAAVDYQNGELYINQERAHEFGDDTWRWILEHENAHVLHNNGDEFAADNLALNRSLHAGASMKTILQEIQKFLHFSSDAHKQRLTRLKTKALNISTLLLQFPYDYSVRENRIKAMSEIVEKLETEVALQTVRQNYEPAIVAASQLRDMAQDPLEADYYEGVVDDLQALQTPVASADGRRHRNRQHKGRKSAFDLLNIANQAKNELEKHASFCANIFLQNPEKAIEIAKKLRNAAQKSHISHFFQEVVDDLKGKHVAHAGFKDFFKKKDKGTASTPQTGKQNPPPRRKGPLNTFLANMQANNGRKQDRKDLKASSTAEAKIKNAEAKQLKAIHGSNADADEKKGKWADGVKAITSLAGGIVGAFVPGTGPLIAEGGDIASQLIRGPVKDENGNIVEQPTPDQIAAQLAAENAAIEVKAKEDAAAKKKTMWLIIGGVVTLVAVIGGVVFYFMKKGKTAVTT